MRVRKVGVEGERGRRTGIIVPAPGTAQFSLTAVIQSAFCLHSSPMRTFRHHAMLCSPPLSGRTTQEMLVVPDAATRVVVIAAAAAVLVQAPTSGDGDGGGGASLHVQQYAAHHNKLGHSPVPHIHHQSDPQCATQSQGLPRPQSHEHRQKILSGYTDFRGHSIEGTLRRVCQSVCLLSHQRTAANDFVGLEG